MTIFLSQSELTKGGLKLFLSNDLGQSQDAASVRWTVLCDDCKLKGIQHKPNTPYNCPQCKIIYQASRRKSRWKKESSNSYLKQLKLHIREFILHQKSDKPCLDCGLTYEPYQMQFDHRDESTKIIMLSQACNRRWNDDRILSEINKCDLVCVGCHRDRTQSRLQYKSFRSSPSRFNTDQFIKELKSGPCVDCNKYYSSWKMDFDHLPGFNKIGILSLAKVKGWSRQRILDEVKKCELVCCWCHAERTFRRQHQ